MRVCLIKKQIVIRSLLSGLIISAVLTLAAFTINRDTFLAELLIGFVAVASLLGGAVVALIIQLLNLRYGRKLASYVTLAIVISLAGLGLWGI